MTPAPTHDSPNARMLILHTQDNVAVVPASVSAGQRLACDAMSVTAAQPIPAGHKVALDGIRAGDPVVKYGQTIGFATADIFMGDHVHSHNLAVGDFDRDYAFCADARPVEYVPEADRLTFQGYARPDGRVGTRNYVAIVSSVNCSASVSKYVQQRFGPERMRAEFPGVDGVIALTHKTGCCVQPGEPMRVLQRTLVGMARHPNVFGYVMVGLGCEGVQIDQVRDRYQLGDVPADQPAPAFMNIQATGGVAETIDRAAAAVEALCAQASACQRTTQPISALTLAMNCGGSDGNSGITANPALGYAAETLIRHGGAAVLAETTEIYGAEHLLARRAVDEQVAQRLVDRVRWWEDHVALFGASIDNNPTPGNKAGGLTTIYEKSLGAVAKAGQSPLAAVYAYAEPVTARGLCFMDTPGFDPVSMTGLVAGGRKAEEVGRDILETILRVASGEATKSEAMGIGDEEFAPWVLGPTL